jgi:methylated-DNA-[protein]-cysteine S-methyltransferase
MTDLVLVPPLPPGRASDDDPPGLVRLDSPVGRIEIVGRHFAVAFDRQALDGALPHDDQPERPDSLLDAARRQIDGYFEGVRTRFDLPFRLVGSSFQRSVWTALLEVEWGRATTYGQLGGTFGNPRAGRAVGGAVAANPLPLLVPCHRVLGRTGGVTGYTVGAGVETKKWLLRHEGIAFRDGPVALD